MIELNTHKPTVNVTGVVTAIGEIQEKPSNNGIFRFQMIGMEILYGKEEMPYIDSFGFQVTNTKTRRKNKQTNTWEDAPSYLAQFEEKPLKIGDVISVRCVTNAYVGGGAKSSVTVIPKTSLEYLYRHDLNDSRRFNELFSLALSLRQKRA